MSNTEIKSSMILGQKYAYATVALILGIFCFINLAGMEKAILAIIFAWLALRRDPEPLLRERRSWARAGMTMGVLLLVVVPILIFFTFGRMREVFDVIIKLGNGR